jgi:hypothetical protein
MVAANNAVLYNAAIEGFVAGTVKGRWLTAKNSGTPPAIGTADPSYAALVQQATYFAEALDVAVPTDDTAAPQPAGTQPISVITTGVAIAPTTGAIQCGQLAKTRLFSGTSLGYAEGRYYPQPTELTNTQLAALATSVAATYQQVAEGVLQPLVTSPATNNEVLFFAAYAGIIAGCFSATPNGLPAPQLLTFEGYAQELAAAIDAGIANDATISTGASQGPALAPTTGAIQIAQVGKSKLLYSITLAVCEQRNPLSVGLTTIPEWQAWAATIAPAVIAGYKALIGGLTTGTSTSVLNPLLYNEAYCGFIAGHFGGRPLTSTSTTDPWYVATGAAAVAFAAEVDATVGASDVAGTPVPAGTQAITVGGETPTAIVPTTGTIQEGELGKSGLIWAICRGVEWGRPLLNSALDTTSSTYLAIAQSVVALYLDLATVLTTP